MMRSDVLRMALADMRRRRGRALALLIGLVVATSGFIVLTSNTETARLEVIGTVHDSARGAYDILVRPAGARTDLETHSGLVRPNFLSGQYGGISMAQYERIRQIPGVSVAAPIAMIGYVTVSGSVRVDLTDLVDTDLTRQVFRIRLRWSAERGLTVYDDDASQFVYVTRRPVVWPFLGPDGQVEWSDGKSRPETAPQCGGTLVPIEVQEDESERAVCEFAPEGEQGPLGNLEHRSVLRVVQLRPDNRFVEGYYNGQEVVRERLIPSVYWPLSLLLAAVDPQAEADLVGLDAAVTAGRYLSAEDRPTDLGTSLMTSVPVLASSQPFLDEALVATPDRLVGPVVDSLAGRSWAEAWAALEAAPAEAVGPATTHTSRDAYASVALTGIGQQVAHLNPVIRSGDVEYAQGTGVLVPQPATVDPAVFVDPRMPTAPSRPWLIADRGFRPLDQAPSPADRFLVAEAVGVFDPGRLRGFSELSALPLETYFPPKATGADDRTRDLLDGLPLEPNSNPAGYLTSPPLLLTSLEGFPGLTSSPAPISAIRVRVAGVTGVDDVSRERVRLVAEAIATATGLDVDITVGSSPAPQTVALPAGEFGRPDLLLSEQWSVKGVATQIVQAVDRKSLLMFGLILVMCVLFVTNGATAAVRERRREFAILACLGWPRSRIAGLVAIQVGTVALVAGCVSGALALPLARALGMALPPMRAALAIPVAILVALSAALRPVLLAANSHPATSLRPLAQPTGRRRPWPARTIVGLALTNLSRARGRTALAVAALAMAVAASALLTSITVGFHGSVTGSMLGDAVSLQVRGVDMLSVGVAVVLALAVVADVLYLNMRDRANEFAVLAAAGWSPRAIARLVVAEGVGIGLLASIIGAAAGVAGTFAFAATAPPGYLWVLAVTAVAGTVLAALAALVPALVQRRITLSTLLAEE